MGGRAGRVVLAATSSEKMRKKRCIQESIALEISKATKLCAAELVSSVLRSCFSFASWNPLGRTLNYFRRNNFLLYIILPAQTASWKCAGTICVLHDSCIGLGVLTMRKTSAPFSPKISANMVRRGGYLLKVLGSQGIAQAGA